MNCLYGGIYWICSSDLTKLLQNSKERCEGRLSHMPRWIPLSSRWKSLEKSNCDGIVEKRNNFPQVEIARVEMQGFPGTLFIHVGLLLGWSPNHQRFPPRHFQRLVVLAPNKNVISSNHPFMVENNTKCLKPYKNHHYEPDISPLIIIINHC